MRDEARHTAVVPHLTMTVHIVDHEPEPHIPAGSPGRSRNCGEIIWSKKSASSAGEPCLQIMVMNAAMSSMQVNSDPAGAGMTSR